ncbi:MAG TPA: monovalent cation/H+ antiporter subunit D family protein [Candidatus Bathyarchaeia archaeon]|nr:monovalent cation/H+ antiporter subunit D family protein [Candidatus Bathyarchaeia archaeon]
MLPIEQFPVLVVAISLLSALTILLAGGVNRKSCFFISLATITFQFILSIFILRHVLTVGTIHYWLGGWRPPWGIEYVVDVLNAYVLIIVLFLSLLAAIYSKRSVEQEIEARKLPVFYTLFQILVTGLAGVVVTGDMFNLYVFLEIASLAGYALIAAAGGRALRASYNYLILGALGICFYLLAIAFLYSVTGTLNMADLRVLLPTLYANKAVQTAFVFAFIGLGIKCAIFPLHTWQPDAYTYAPSAISVIISTAMAKASIYALIRVIFSVFTVDFITLFPIFDIISWIAAIAMIFGSILAIAQFDLKRMLAYSSIANIGYIMLGVGLSTSTTLGLTPALMHILNHALMKGCLFMAACAFIYKADLRDIRDLVGLGRKMPYTCFAFLLASLSMIGLPPSVGFVTKLYLILAALDAGEYIFVAVVFFSTLLMIVYFWHVIEIMYIRVEGGGGNKISTGEAPMSMFIPGLVLAVLCFIMGIIWLIGTPLPLMDAINSGLGLGVVP